ncbi:succinyldiaminopimelate transaminase [Sulfurirhabdus autotrophica]|uniref:Succinyldiaminopimelate aminotransferase n=1 Tax=Sulfurirhabdus autotrophica TaxID=1706046 RepID=A0A4R3YHR9_9PROT|nr:succinyldiaminopimelate transaminase [Sulfurirhabdus autotrophica]TCV90143.1 succinyldiaminopimelate aminotransferase [Sulfurirhabdus autotrophica]
MNPNLQQLHPYPFQKLRTLFQGITPNSTLPHINLSIGEPKHATPEFIRESLIKNLDGLSNYPLTQGTEALRNAIGTWLKNRYGLPEINVQNQVLPVTGSREALFAFAQAVIDPTKPNPVIISPNPFYQIYEGAAILAGATPYFINTTPDSNYVMDFASVPKETLARTQLVYVCSPGNPTGKVMSLGEWENLFKLSDEYGFTIASDECYSEIYFDGSHPPLGALQAAHQLGRVDFPKLVVFSSLSKRSNVPGMRSGFVAGNASILEQFLLYRTYHGCAMNPAVQAASAAAWSDESHVEENRRMYSEKFASVTPMLQGFLQVEIPDAAFYLWAKTPISDTEFAQRLYRDYNVTVLPGSYLARDAHGINPGQNFIRIALVASLEECVDAAERIKQCVENIEA